MGTIQGPKDEVQYDPWGGITGGNDNRKSYPHKPSTRPPVIPVILPKPPTPTPVYPPIATPPDIPIVLQPGKPPEPKYAGSGVLGTARSVGDNINVLQLIGKFWGGAVSSGQAVISRFMGIFTKPGRDHAPLGALEDVRNLEPNVKTGALTLRKGSSAYASSFVDVSSVTTLTHIDDFFPMSTEVPSASDIDIVLGQTAGSVKHIFQKPFWNNGAKVNSFVDFNETLSDNLSAGPTFPGGTFYINDTARAEKYFKDWFCFFPATGSGPYLVTDYVAGEVTVTPQLSTGIQNADEVVFYRFPLFDVDSTDPIQYSTTSGKSPVCLQQGQAILFSGGQSSSKSHRALWAGYISRTWLLGALNKELGVSTARTEVSWADVSLKTPNGIATGIANPLVVGNLTSTGVTAGTGLSNGKWFVRVIPVTDDGILGMPMKASTSSVLVSSDDTGVRFTLILRLPHFNKRVRYLKIALGKSANETDIDIDWGSLYVVKTLDLTLGTDWTFTETAGTTTGFYSQTITLDATHINAPEIPELVSLYGMTEPNGTEVSFSIADFVSGRLFIAKYYDYTSGLEFNDHIRYSGVSGDGIFQLNFLGDSELFSITTLGLGDTTSIQGLKKWEDKLFVIKDSSCYYLPITADVTATGGPAWSVVTVSPYIGCTAPKTLVATPYGIMWCQPGDDIYIWDGGSPVSMTQDTWRETFKALTIGATWYGWFLTEKKCYSFFNYTSQFWYSMYFEVPIAEGIYSWYKHDIPNNFYGEIDQNIVNRVEKFVATRNGVSYFIYNFTDDTMATNDRIGFLSTSATYDLGLGIIPYLKTAELYLDEVMLSKVMKFWIGNASTGVNSLSNFVVKISLGSNSKSYTFESSIPALISRGIPQDIQTCRKIQIELNANVAVASQPATFTTLDIHQIGFKYELKPFVGDKTITS